MAFIPGLPVNDQGGHFMRDRLRQKISEVFRQQFEVDAQRRFTATPDFCLTCTAATQGEIYQRLRQGDGVEIARPLFGLTHRLYGKLLYLFRGLSHLPVSRAGRVQSVIVRDGSEASGACFFIQARASAVPCKVLLQTGSLSGC